MKTSMFLIPLLPSAQVVLFRQLQASIRLRITVCIHGWRCSASRRDTVINQALAVRINRFELPSTRVIPVSWCGVCGDCAAVRQHR